MATRKISNPRTGQVVEAEVVNIAQLTDPPIRIVLEDGSELGLKTDIIEVSRIPDEWDNEGHPIYSLKSSNSMAVLDSPDELKRPNNGSA